jgi:tetratricopeptide (TPR) repeat protein
MRWLAVTLAVCAGALAGPPAAAAPVLIDGVPRMDWTTGRFSLHISALYSALQAMGCQARYEEMMVASGAAFRTAWLPGRYGYASAEVAPEDVVANAAEYAGGLVERRSHASAEEAWPVICESVDAGRPVLCWRRGGLGVICGYDPERSLMYLREYQNATDEYAVVPLELQDAAYPHKVRKELLLIEYEPAQPVAELDWPRIMERAIQWAEWPADDRPYPDFVLGLAAYDAWSQTLRGGMDSGGPDTDARVTEFMARVLADARASASVVLQDSAALHEAFVDAASAYMEEASLLKAMPAVLSDGNARGAFAKTTIAMKACFPKQAVREQAAQLVEQARAQELVAIEALKRALADLKTAPAEGEAEGAPDKDAAPTGQPNTEEAKRLCEEGKRLKAAGKHAEAAEVLRAAAQADPGLADAHWVLGWVLVELKDTEGAAKAFKRVIELEPDSDRAREAQQALDRLK